MAPGRPRLDLLSQRAKAVALLAWTVGRLLSGLRGGAGLGVCVRLSLIAAGGPPGQRKRGWVRRQRVDRDPGPGSTWARVEFPKFAESGLAEAGLPGGYLTVQAPVFILNGSPLYLVLCNDCISGYFCHSRMPGIVHHAR